MSFPASESSPRGPQCLASLRRTFPRLMVKNEAVFRCRNSPHSLLGETAKKAEISEQSSWCFKIHTGALGAQNEAFK
ncbi:unnamed protein product [Rangifer tarandus platyrhynchus]|uniref:Uncharacterized protein n=1 Tax=Rangifer tarandus platyrhynchus TaxID=3082113 RepID=A0AC59Y1T3_RANTA